MLAELENEKQRTKHFRTQSKPMNANDDERAIHCVCNIGAHVFADSILTI